MAYDTNPRLPRLRARAVEMVKSGKSVTEVARYFGFTKGAVSKWCKKYPPNGMWAIPTASCAPKSHPWRIDKKVRTRICELRLKLKGRCAQVIQSHLADEGMKASVRTIQRELERNHLLKKYSPWKKHHMSGQRPMAEKPGDLVQLDTIHLMVSERRRIYVYTMIDVATRTAYALAGNKISTGRSVRFLNIGIRKTTISPSCTGTEVLAGVFFNIYFLCIKKTSSCWTTARGRQCLFVIKT
jgi:transposase-like protein